MDSVPVERAGLDLHAALELLCQTFPSEERASRIGHLLKANTAGTISLEDCLIVRQQSRIAAVILLVHQTDGTIYLWPVSVAAGVTPYDADRWRTALYAEAVRMVDSSGAWIAQTLLDHRDVDLSRELGAHGFPRLTDLQFMNRPLTLPVLTMEPAPGTRFIAFDETAEGGNVDRFAAVIERTCQGTFDCPELNGRRNGFESLQGHRLAGCFAPERWLLLSENKLDAGVLLMTEHSAENVWEVVYFGVVPESRGRGAGRQLLRKGFEMALRAGADEVVLAVDVRNTPAIRLYGDLGFLEFDRRIVHARLPTRE